MAKLKVWKSFSVFMVLMLVAALGAALVPGSPVRAATINVPADYATIQLAVNAAGASDTINVVAGTYNEAVSIPAGKDGLEIAGASGAILDGTGLGDVNGFNIASDNVKIHGFTIQNFTSEVTYKGAGIYAEPGTQGGELYDNTIKDG